MTQARLFGADTLVLTVTPAIVLNRSVHSHERARLKRQTLEIIARLQQGPASNRELADLSGSLNFRARISDRIGGTVDAVNVFPSLTDHPDVGGVQAMATSDSTPTRCRALPDCNRPLQCHGLCNAHYQQQKRGKPFRPAMNKPLRRCMFEGCSRWHAARGYCLAHVKQIYDGGTVHPIGWKPTNDWVDCGSHLEAVLRNKLGREMGRALVDRDDAPLLTNYRWFLGATGYVQASPRNGRDEKLWMHRVILGLSGPFNHRTKLTDHISGNRLDNRRSNLRVVTAQQNAENVTRPNRSLDRNVHFDRRVRARLHPWLVQARKFGRKHYGGAFATKEEARIAAKVLRARLFTGHNEARHSEPS